MGASLAVILANLWLKKYEFALIQETPSGTEIKPLEQKRFVAMLPQESNI